MNSLVERANLLGGQAVSFVLPLLWQSSALILILFALDWALRRKLRASVRYALWLVVLVKLMLPPSLALPTGIGWWIRPAAPTPAPQQSSYVVSYGELSSAAVPVAALAVAPTPFRARISFPAAGLACSLVVSLGLITCMLMRWRQVARRIQQCGQVPERLSELLVAAVRQAGLRRPIRLKLTDSWMSPALCGLLRPVVLLPRALLERLPADQLQAVLLHECLHLKRRDTWINCLQSLLQILYWWHPLLWLANARIRRLREEAVDDAVISAMKCQSDIYVPTLLQVARLSLVAPVATLGLVGIVESKTALKQRVERLINSNAPQKAGLTLLPLIGILGFAAAALPMGQSPGKPATPADLTQSIDSPWPDPRFSGYNEVEVEAQFFSVEASALKNLLSLKDLWAPLIFGSNEVASLESLLQQAQCRYFASQQNLSFQKFSGGRFQWQAGGCTNNRVSYNTVDFDGQTFVTGADADWVGTESDWKPLLFRLVPWKESDGIRCEVELKLAQTPDPAQAAEVIIPSGGAMLWGARVSANPEVYQLVVLREGARLEKTTATQDSPEPSSAPNAGSNSSAVNEMLQRLRAALAATAQKIEKNHAGRQEQSLSTNQSRAKSSTSEKFSRVGSTEMLDRLKSIRIDRIDFDQVPLGQVVTRLNQEARKHDHQGRPVRFLLTRGIDSPTGLPIVPEAGAANDINSLTITLEPFLIDVRIIDVLDAIMKVAPKRIKYSIEDYAVVISPASPEREPLYVRIFTVDTDLLSKLRDQVALTEWTTPGDIYDWVRQSLLGMGIDLSPPRNIYFRPANRMMIVRNTREELDRIELILQGAALPITNAVPGFNFPNFRVRPLTNTQSSLPDSPNQFDTRSLKVDPHTGLQLQSPKTLSSATAPVNAAPAVHIEAQVVDLKKVDARRRGNDPSLEKLLDQPFDEQGAGVLSDAQFRVVVRALEQREGADFLSRPTLITQSGREAQIQIIHTQTVVRAINPLALSSPGVRSSTGVAPSIYLTESLACGSVLEVMPQAASDGRTIELQVTAKVTELMDVDSRKDESVRIYVDGKRRRVKLPRSQIRIRTFEAKTQLLDGQTLALQNFKGSITSFDSGGKSVVTADDRRDLLIFVTPILVDPLGNRVHTAEQR